MENASEASELDNWPNNPSNNFKIQKGLFGVVKLTRNVTKRKFIYNGYGKALDEVLV